MPVSDGTTELFRAYWLLAVTHRMADHPEFSIEKDVTVAKATTYVQPRKSIYAVSWEIFSAPTESVVWDYEQRGSHLVGWADVAAGNHVNSLTCVVCGKNLLEEVVNSA